MNRNARPKKAGTKDRMTLDRALSKAGLCSRTEALRRIRSGRVRINGRVVRDPELWISTSRDTLECDGRPLRRPKQLYLMLYKPTGVVTSHGDPDQRKTVYDLLPDLESWVFPIGRLDLETSGLLLLTNDTEFGERLTNPLSRVPKTYQLKVNFHPTPEQIRTLEEGIVLADGQCTLPAQVKILRRNAKYSFLELVIVEGKNRQVRRMIEALGGRVVKLVRTRIGTLSLADLPIGQYRLLTRHEVADLRSSKPAEGGHRPPSSTAR